MWIGTRREQLLEPEPATDYQTAGCESESARVFVDLFKIPGSMTAARWTTTRTEQV
jgi:hypothetical protein